MRTITALLASVLVAAMATASPTAAAPDGPGIEKAQRAKITLSASPEYVRKGGIVTLTGKVTGGRTTVTIFQKNKGARKWVVEAVKRTNRKGRFSHREDVNTGDRTYRACAKGRCASVYVHMGKKPKPPKPEPAATAVSISGLSATQVEAGQAFTVAGTASPNLNGRQVSVQAYDAGSSAWTSVSTATVQNGAWSVPTAVSTAGKAIPLRAAFGGGIGLQPSTSTAANITVYGWYYMYDEGPLDAVSGSWYSMGSATMNAAVYGKSVGLNPQDSYRSNNSSIISVEFNLGRACTRLETVVGLSDNTSDTARLFNASLKGDSLVKYSATGIAYAAPRQVSVDVSNILRLRVEAAQTAGAYAGTLYFGDMRVLCAF